MIMSNKQNEDGLLFLEDGIAFHPGYYINEYIQSQNMTIREFSVKMNVLEKDMDLILLGNAFLTKEMIVRLSEITGVSTVFWENIQNSYKEALEHFSNSSGLI